MSERFSPLEDYLDVKEPTEQDLQKYAAETKAKKILDQEARQVFSGDQNGKSDLLADPHAVPELPDGAVEPLTDNDLMIETQDAASEKEDLFADQDCRGPASGKVYAVGGEARVDMGKLQHPAGEEPESNEPLEALAQDDDGQEDDDDEDDSEETEPVSDQESEERGPAQLRVPDEHFKPYRRPKVGGSSPQQSV